jgi:hypothetical protein
MKQEDIIRMAREAGFVEYELEDYTQSGYDIRYERFAALVAAAENEACAKLLEESSGTGKLVSCMSAAAAIRARGQA